MRGQAEDWSTTLDMVVKRVQDEGLTIEQGKEIFCDVHGFYPDTLKPRRWWRRRRKERALSDRFSVNKTPGQHQSGRS